MDGSNFGLCTANHMCVCFALCDSWLLLARRAYQGVLGCRRHGGGLPAGKAGGGAMNDYRIEFRIDAKTKTEAVAWLQRYVADLEQKPDQSWGCGGGSGPCISFYMGRRPLN